MGCLHIPLNISYGVHMKNNELQAIFKKIDDKFRSVQDKKAMVQLVEQDCEQLTIVYGHVNTYGEPVKPITTFTIRYTLKDGSGRYDSDVYVFVCV